MVLQIIQSGYGLPISYPVDGTAVFNAGAVGQLYLQGNNIVCGVSDGTAPIGLIDDYKTTAFTAPSYNEEVIETGVLSTNVGGKIVSAADVKVELRNPHITPNSFVSDVDVALNTRNGIVTFPQGTELNLDADGDGINDSLRAVVSYTYQVPNVPGEDTTMASGRVTIWFQRMIASTDQFETTQRYPLGNALFVSESGLLTTREPEPGYPAVAVVTGPPSGIGTDLQFLWL